MKTIQKPDVARKSIDKETAKRWLGRISPVQRPLNPNRRGRFARVMNAGGWLRWIPVIAFDRKEELINGQHVLSAFVLSNLKELSVTVSRNHETEDYRGFDKNGTKSVRDDLRAEGVPHVSQLTAAISVIWQHELGFFDGTRYLSIRGGMEFPESFESVSIYRTHPGIEQHLHKNPSKHGRYSIGALRAASWILHQYYPELAPHFFDSVLKGVNIPTVDHPASRLQKELFNIDKDHKALGAGATLARIFKAFVLYRDNKTVDGPTLLKKNEDFPDIRVTDDAVAKPAPRLIRKKA